MGWRECLDYPLHQILFFFLLYISIHPPLRDTKYQSNPPIQDNRLSTLS